MGQKKNSNKRTDTASARRTEKWLIAITGIIIGLTLIVASPVIINWVKTIFVREPDYTVKILNTTYHLPDKAYETTISDLHIIKININAPTRVSGLSKVKFSVKYKNIGKAPIENPYLRVYIIDSLNRVLAEWQGEVNKDKFKEGILFAVDSLSAKGKEIYGKIHMYVLAYDRRTDKTALVSYLLSSTEIKSRSRSEIILAIIGIVGVIVAMPLVDIFSNFIAKRRRARRKTSQE